MPLYGVDCGSVAVLQIYNKEPGNISPRMAEMRADLGNGELRLDVLGTNMCLLLLRLYAYK